MLALTEPTTAKANADRFMVSSLASIPYANVSVLSSSDGDRTGNGERFGQAMKGARRMPWCQEAMKDVVSCDKPRGAANRL